MNLFEEKIQAMRRQMEDDLKSRGKVWLRGESTERLDPALRVYVEKRINPEIRYPVVKVLLP